MTRFGGRRGVVLALTAALGLVLILVGVLGQRTEQPAHGRDRGSLAAPESADPPPRPSTRDSPPRTDPSDTADPAAQPLGPSTPVSISVPSIGVSSEVIQLGTTPQGTLAVPQPGPDLDKAAWFENSPTPGQPGPSVIEGHVATEQNGPSIFFDLAEVQIGDEVVVQREDGRDVVFTVHATREFDKDSFPTRLVYGGELSTPTLRLITCSSFDPDVGHHTGNLVVFARLTDVRPATTQD